MALLLQPSLCHEHIAQCADDDVCSLFGQSLAEGERVMRCFDATSVVLGTTVVTQSWHAGSMLRFCSNAQVSVSAILQPS